MQTYCPTMVVCYNICWEIYTYM